jgi:uncharacterized membrane protein (GlpM family)
MTEAEWLPLLIRVVAASGVVVLASLVAERVGPFFGGLIATLPVSTGPAYVLLAIDHDDAFIAQTALSSVATNVTMIAYLVALVLASPRARMPVSLGGAIALWIGGAVLLRFVPWTVAGALAVNVAAYGVAYRLLRSSAPEPVTRRAVSRWYDVPLRAVLVGLLVVGVTTASSLIGPAATGIGAIFPIALSSLTAVVHQRLGGAAASATMRGAVVANPGFLLSVLSVHLLAEPAGRWWALATGLAVSLSWSAGLLVWKTWRRFPLPSGERVAGGSRPGEGQSKDP